MKRVFIISALICAGILVLGQDRILAGQTPGRIEARLSGKLHLSDLLAYAYMTNPAITASKESWQVFIENYRIGKSLPDPRLATTYFPAPIETRLGPQDWNLTLSQAIPFPGTLSQKGKVLESDVNISRLKVDKAVKEIVALVSASFYELVYIQKALGIAEANLDLSQKLMGISQNAYARDKAVFYDLSKARARTAQIQYDMMLLQELEQTEKAMLNTLLNRPPGADLGQAIDAPQRDTAYILDEIYGLAMVHQEEILIAEEALEKAEEAINLSRYETLPSFNLGLFYAGIGQPDLPSPPQNAGDDAMGVQLGLNLPLWFGKNKSRTAKALAVREKARADKTSVANRTKAGISRLWFKLQNAKRLITLYETNLLPQALSSVQTAESWFREDQGNFSDFLEVQATAYNFQLALERARADYGQTLVKLEQLAGVILDKRAPQKGQEEDKKQGEKERKGEEKV